MARVLHWSPREAPSVQSAGPATLDPRMNRMTGIGRTSRRLVALLLGAATVSCDNKVTPPPVDDGMVRSTFDESSEGWTVIGDADTAEWMRQGGHPGGHMRAVDDQ